MTTPPPNADAPYADDSQLPWRVWLARNGFFLAAVVVVFLALFYSLGGESVWAILKAAIGLGFVVFIHELGHFAVAKWCDVHVETFSIGFGPALPGCSFRKGETLYKVALVPLGGYVKMLGEGSENEDEDEDPRSFKNKTVGQRMAIISAGVIMNVILGCICFIAAYRGGVKQTAGVIASIEPGSPAWTEGVRTGSLITHVGDIQKPYFEDVKFEVMLSRHGEQIPFGFERPVEAPGKTVREEILIEPRREEHDPNPVIGASFPPELELWSARDIQRLDIPVVSDAAAAARVLAIDPGDTVLAATDPARDLAVTDLPEEPAARYQELARRLRGLGDRPLVLRVRKAGGGVEQVEVPATGFLPGDRIVGTTAVEQENGYDPFRVEPLPRDVLRDPHGDRLDYFEFHRRLQDLAGKPMVIQVARADASPGSPPVPVFVPPAYYHTFGMRMGMGRITAVRDESSARKAGVQPNDVLSRVELTDAAGDRVHFVLQKDGKAAEERVIDPLRLPDELRAWAEGREGVRATLTVLRDEHHEMGKAKTLPEVPWDQSWAYNEEVPYGLRAPLSIPELGLAYQVKTVIEEVRPDSPAARAGLQKGDTILEIRLRTGTDSEGKPEWGPWTELWTEQKSADNQKHPEDWWAHVFWRLQAMPLDREVQLKVRREVVTANGAAPGASRQVQEFTVESLRPTPADGPANAWPRTERGLQLDLVSWRLQKADSVMQALSMGTQRTYRSIIQVYKSLSSMITNRVSATKNLRGPISIATTAYAIAGEDFNTFILFLGLISVNLAVVNFLPIPVLDGGHMVFLIYEKIRGKPASEQVRLLATYVGLFLILSLMAFVIFLDVKRQITGM